MASFIRSLSIVKKVGVLIIALSLFGITGMIISSWLSNSIQGNAHAINEIGAMRMRSYQLLSFIPLNSQQKQALDRFPYYHDKNNHDQNNYIQNSNVQNNNEQNNPLQEINNTQINDENSNEKNLELLMQVVAREQLIDEFEALKKHWDNNVKPSLLSAQKPENARDVVDSFILELNRLIASIDYKTEYKLQLTSKILSLFIFLSLLLTIVSIAFLRLRIIQPWQQLIDITNSISKGNFTQRFKQSRFQDEMSILGDTINSMSAQLSRMYEELELRVQQKTLHILQQNKYLSFLYRTSTQLRCSSLSTCLRFLPILKELENLTSLTKLQLKLYESNNVEQFELFSTHNAIRPSYCSDQSCRLCLEPPVNSSVNLEITQWPLRDLHGEYGIIIGYYLPEKKPTTLQLQLIETLVEQLSTSLALEQQEYKNQQLMLMKERTVIARELHDSIAQSLSCLKIKISCLQMQSTNLLPKQLMLVQEMRTEVNSAYSQLRELLTTFRLKLNEPGLLPALESTIKEFNQRLGFSIILNYQLPPKSVSSHQAIHLIQIVREALNNIYKHANASQASITLTLESHNKNIQLLIRDNGKGLSSEAIRLNHYGLTIMNDRASNLPGPGQCSIYNHPSGGVEVKVVFNANQVFPVTSGVNYDK